MQYLNLYLPGFVRLKYFINAIKESDLLRHDLNYLFKPYASNKTFKEKFKAPKIVLPLNRLVLSFRMCLRRHRPRRLTKN